MKNTRSQTIARSGYLFIFVNFLLAFFNLVVGLISNSLAIISDAIHSLIDSISGFLIVISEKIANHHKFSHKREQIERVTTIIIALIIVGVGLHIVVESIEKIIAPEPVDYNLAIFIVLFASIIVKLFLATYLKETGKSIKSKVLIASGAETMNDTWISIAVFISALLYILFHVDIEGYISIVIAIIVIKIGLEFIFPHLSKHHHHHLEQNPEHSIHPHK